MSDMTTNFSRHEFACNGENCCDHSAPINERLVHAAQIIRDEVNVSMSPTNGYRCKVHNRSVGSKDSSQHCIGLAADFPAPEGYTLDEFYQLCSQALYKYMQNGGGCAIYPDRGIVHIDVRLDTCWRARVDG